MTDYTYEVVKTDAQLKVMEVRYTVVGIDEINVGMPLPEVGQTLDEVVQQYAPIAHWKRFQTQFADVAVGSKGNARRGDAVSPVVDTQPQPDATRAANAAMFVGIRFEQAVAAALIKFGVLTQDPTTIGVTKL